MNLIDGRRAGGMAELGTFRLPVQMAAQTPALMAAGAVRTVIFGVWPENLVLESGAPGEALIFDNEDQGVVKILVMDVGDARVHGTVPAGTKVVRDELVRFGWKSDRILTFDPQTGANLALV
jgi:multiple sugar transport system ATP-binding protein